MIDDEPTHLMVRTVYDEKFNRLNGNPIFKDNLLFCACENRISAFKNDGQIKVIQMNVLVGRSDGILFSFAFSIEFFL